MQTQTQGEGGFGAQASHGVTDWHALEVQLNRTRVILQEILLHLQEVLHNLKSVRNGANAFASAPRGEAAGHARESRSATAGAGEPFRAQNTRQTQTGRERFQGASAGTAQGTSERFRTKARQPGFEGRAAFGGQTRSGTGSQFRFTAGGQAKTEASGDSAGTGKGASFRAGTSSSRTTGSAGSFGSRERTRTEHTWRTRTTGQGTEREARTRQAASSQRTASRTTTRSQGFHMDSDRQYRARQMARKCGMNLKCAYDILCLDYPCSADEIKSAYRHMARIHHPDLGGDEEAMKDVNVAYELAMRFCSGPRQTSTAWAV